MRIILIVSIGYYGIIMYFHFLVLKKLQKCTKFQTTKVCFHTILKYGIGIKLNLAHQLCACMCLKYSVITIR